MNYHKQERFSKHTNIQVNIIKSYCNKDRIIV